ncbi:MAG: hypothetical protein O2887_08555 [Bacteroidetes bacterium]|nr:hypothetical protein [Bacteroidota bacterium]MDA1120529.1 hypothetical protein [Bacteroidota bacterium]
METLFGPIQGQIIKQENNIRIVHLRDENGNSRTLGVARFLNTDHNSVLAAHTKILAGGLIGKTLIDSNIDYNKEILGSFQVKLPDWLMHDFKTLDDSCLAIYSRISLNGSSTSEEQLLYAELIEVIPPELKEIFEEKTKPLDIIEPDLFSLMETANLVVIQKQNG